MGNRLLTFFGVGVLALTMGSVALAQQADGDIPRTPSGRPDLSGTYDTATLTPLQRPTEYGDNLFLSEEEAAEIAARAERIVAESFDIPAERNETTDVPREAPPVGGDGSTGGAGNSGRSVG